MELCTIKFTYYAMGPIDLLFSTNEIWLTFSFQRGVKYITTCIQQMETVKIEEKVVFNPFLFLVKDFLYSGVPVMCYNILVTCRPQEKKNSVICYFLQVMHFT